jgi:hypothetical protein
MRACAFSSLHVLQHRLNIVHSQLQLGQKLRASSNAGTVTNEDVTISKCRTPKRCAEDEDRDDERAEVGIEGKQIGDTSNIKSPTALEMIKIMPVYLPSGDLGLGG